MVWGSYSSHQGFRNQSPFQQDAGLGSEVAGDPPSTHLLPFGLRELPPPSNQAAFLKMQHPSISCLLGSCARLSRSEDTTSRMGLSGGCGHSPSLTHDFLLLLPGGGTRNLYDLKVVSGILSLLVAGGGLPPLFAPGDNRKGARFRSQHCPSSWFQSLPVCRKVSLAQLSCDPLVPSSLSPGGPAPLGLERLLSRVGLSVEAKGGKEQCPH